MNIRPYTLLGIVACVEMLAWFLPAFIKATKVPSDQFGDTLRKQPAITVNSQTTRAPEALPLALRIRFPKQASRGSSGFVDRSDVYTLNSGSGDIECTAHIRGDRVCHVTLDGHDGTEPMRDEILSLFPGLSMD